MMNKTRHIGATGVAVLSLLSLHANAQLVISDTLTGKSSQFKWMALNGACLTAGDGSASTIPACNGLAYYAKKTQVGGQDGTIPDIDGSGALRLTNGDTTTTGSNGTNQTGAVVSNFIFPTDQGLQVTFTTVTYGGNSYTGIAKNTGADGISFFLSDGSQDPTVGGLGGSLGYSCSNGNATYDGVAGGYIGIGIDEFGNFSNKGDNTSTGPGQGASRISLRGAGNTNWAYLSTGPYAKYYPSGKNGLAAADQKAAVQNTCKTGKIWDYSNGVKNAAATSIALPYNYNFIQKSDLPSNVVIQSQQAVPTPKRSAATPITYALKITQDGLLTLQYSYNGGATQTVVSNQKITDSNGPLPKNFRFGFSAGTGGGSNVHEITCFKAAPVTQSNSSGGINTQPEQRVQVGTQLYVPYYKATNWWGGMAAQQLLMDSQTGVVTVSTTATWDASCTLTGGQCKAMDVNNTGGPTVPAQPSTARTILTWDGSKGVPLQWTSAISTTQQGYLRGTDTAAVGQARLAYLRGDRSNEISTTGSGTFRARDGVLGDIVNSSPAWVGAPALSYSGTWQDSLYPATKLAESGYATYISNNALRQNVVYIGSNDGLVHGFRAGSYDAAGNYVNTNNDGREVLAYMPAAALSTIHSSTATMDYSDTQYGHNLYVDGTPGTGDLFYNGAWHTWLVGGLGGGGNPSGPVPDGKTAAVGGAIYALDVTDPSSFSESNASSLVIGEWNAATLSCANVKNCGNYLGATYGTPVIRRLHNGSWAVMFGNGLNSSAGSAGMYMMMVDPKTGQISSTQYLDTGAGISGVLRNGIAYVTPVDLDGDHIVDYVYAGDVLGNVWRFDLTSQNPNNWSVSKLFSTGGLPITSRVAVGALPISATNGSAQRLMVAFGTGQRFEQTQANAAAYVSGQQRLYGIWDWNMSGWNAVASSGAKYASLSGPQSVALANLQQQTILEEYMAASGTFYRTVSTNPVCWQGSSVCKASNTQYGWYLNLTGKDEQVVYNPTIAYGMFVVNTVIPPSSAAAQTLSCDAPAAKGFTMSVTMAAGGAGKASFFATSNDVFAPHNGNLVSGVGLSATGSSSFVTVGGNAWMVNNTQGGTGVATQINPFASGSAVGSRLNWTKLR